MILKHCLLILGFFLTVVAQATEPDYFGSVPGRLTFDKSPLPRLPQDNSQIEVFGERSFVSQNPELKTRSDIYARYLIRAALTRPSGPRVALDTFLIDVQLTPFAPQTTVVGTLQAWVPSSNEFKTLLTNVKARKKNDSERLETSVAAPFLELRESLVQAEIDPKTPFSIVFRYRDAQGVEKLSELVRFREFNRAGQIPANPHFISQMGNSAKRMQVPPQLGLQSAFKFFYLPARNGILESLHTNGPIGITQKFETEIGASFQSKLTADFVPSANGRTRGHYSPRDLQLTSQLMQPRALKLIAFKLYTRKNDEGHSRVEKVALEIPLKFQRGTHTQTISLKAFEPTARRTWQADDAYVLVFAIVGEQFSYIPGILDQGPVLFVDPEPIGGIILI